MRRIVYNISEIEPYINWLYFYHAWGLSGKPREEKEKMKAFANTEIRISNTKRLYRLV